MFLRHTNLSRSVAALPQGTHQTGGTRWLARCLVGSIAVLASCSGGEDPAPGGAAPGAFPGPPVAPLAGPAPFAPAAPVPVASAPAPAVVAPEVVAVQPAVAPPLPVEVAPPPMAAPPAAAPMPESTRWVLVWSDEFDGAELNRDKWEHEVNCWGGGNDESQCYTDSRKNSWVEDGSLHVQVLREDVRGPAVHQESRDYDADDRSARKPYSSARLRTRNRAEWRYGRFEVRAKMPAGQGTWPAIWMLPTATQYGGWAASGEIDIMEAVNLGVDGENRIHGTIHYGGPWPNNRKAGKEYRLPGGQNPQDDFHVYAIEWEADQMRWFVDGVLYALQNNSTWFSRDRDGNPLGGANAPFDQQFHMILNVAVGGAWAGATNRTGIDEQAFPQEMVVDWVRVYECSLGLASGDGCDRLPASP